MSVYVDEMNVCLQNENWPYKRACHLVADSVEELHYFAGRMMLNPSWFQNHPVLPHYDLTAVRRSLAIKMGAVEIDRNKLVELFREYRARMPAKESRT